MTQKHSFSLPTGNLEVVVRETMSMSFEELMGIGARINPKRGFLFVSKVLGKHIPVKPTTMLQAHTELARQLDEHLSSEPTLFIAMAETATGLGHGVYDACMKRAGSKVTGEWIFATTTRYQVAGHERIAFTEDHSHATDQWLHVPQSGVPLSHIKTLVLIDDEISTGKTLTNLENSLKHLLPSVERVVWVTLTCLAKKTARPLACLLKGEYVFERTAVMEMPANAIGNGLDVSCKLSMNWGRVGVRGFSTLSLACVDKLGSFAAKFKQADKPVLVLGQGEFMHAAFKAGQVLERMGVPTLVQSTTRSPIMVYGAIECALDAPDPMGDGVRHYVYNLNPAAYSHIFVIAEQADSPESQALAAALCNASVLPVDA